MKKMVAEGLVEFMPGDALTSDKLETSSHLRCSLDLLCLTASCSMVLLRPRFAPAGSVARASPLYCAFTRTRWSMELGSWAIHRVIKTPCESAGMVFWHEKRTFLVSCVKKTFYVFTSSFTKRIFLVSCIKRKKQMSHTNSF
jgi:hypothetical protein